MNTAIATKSAKKVLMEYWPLNAFIATNPFWDMREKPFFEVISNANIKGLMPIDYYYNCYQKKLISLKNLHQALELIENRSLNDSDLKQWADKSSREALPPMKSILLSEQIDEYKFQKTTIWIKEKIFALLRDYFGLKIYKKMSLLNFWYQENLK
jgi:hypothetical protein